MLHFTSEFRRQQERVGRRGQRWSRRRRPPPEEAFDFRFEEIGGRNLCRNGEFLRSRRVARTRSFSGTHGKWQNYKKEQL